jgi:hypothetical protein
VTGVAKDRTAAVSGNFFPSTLAKIPNFDLFQPAFCQPPSGEDGETGLRWTRVTAFGAVLRNVR